ncbi:hypothetical protein C8R45DRAFT_948410 [Mycena sanguinolenta]|nr:hypothetical protein C8R45DRAFT_948410 [Mycena sanguinolenta]
MTDLSQSTPSAPLAGGNTSGTPVNAALSALHDSVKPATNSAAALSDVPVRYSATPPLATFDIESDSKSVSSVSSSVISSSSPPALATTNQSGQAIPAATTQLAQTTVAGAALPTATAGGGAPAFLQFRGPWIAGMLYGTWFAITRGRYVGLTSKGYRPENAETPTDRVGNLVSELPEFRENFLFRGREVLRALNSVFRLRVEDFFCRYPLLTSNSAISLNAVTGVASGLSEKYSNQVDVLQHFNTALAVRAIAIP